MSAYEEDFSELIRWKADVLSGYGLSGQRIVDLGCSVGVLPDGLTRANEVVGVDRDPRSLGEAAKRGWKTLCVDLDRAPVPEPAGSFDVALALDVLEHLADPPAALRELGRLLRPQGLLFVSVPNGFNLVNRCLALAGSPLDITDVHHRRGRLLSDHLHRFTRETLAAALRREGFEVQRTESFLPRRVSHRRLRPLQPLLGLARGLGLQARAPGLFAFTFLCVCRRTGAGG
jgi:2-polyprenyl-3-methyl-5-hydroxy-6-metoxy-1,4-benzoquinol methylase